MDESVFEDIHEIAENSAYLKAIEEKEVCTEMWDTLPSYESCIEIERQLERDNKLTFDDIFSEPQGFYMLKSFLITQFCGEKAIFIKDVQNYKKMRFESARRKISKMMYKRYIVAHDESTPPEYKKLVPVFDLTKDRRFFGDEERSVLRSRSEAAEVDDAVSQSLGSSMTASMMASFNENGPITRNSLAFGGAGSSIIGGDFNFDDEDPYDNMPMSSMGLPSAYGGPASAAANSPKPKPAAKITFGDDEPGLPEPMPIKAASSSSRPNDSNNPIGVYGKPIKLVTDFIEKDEAPSKLFDDIARTVLADLKMDMFPRFLKSEQYRNYIKTKSIETAKYDFKKDFVMFRLLGRGGFGAVHACRKRNSGTIYAAKLINKKLVKVKKALDNVLEEKNVLCKMNSTFVTNLKYALQDEENLYLVMDLMLGGDLKFHLINAGRFTEKRARFYAAQVLLGLEHVHQIGIIYRDMKLENILLDHLGNCKLSDLGLAVVTKEKIKGYAGTPGYTAPEMIQNKYYGPSADIFSYGVMLYRMLSGSKPFKGKVDRELDKAVLTRKPAFPKEIFTRDAISVLMALMEKTPEKRLGSGEKGMDEIKEHSFFKEIDWGLLEAGYLEPPFRPNQLDVNAGSLKDIGDFDKGKYKAIKLEDRFKQKTKDFEYVSIKALGEEMAAVLEKVEENAKLAKTAKKSGIDPKDMKGKDKSAKCCVIS